MNALSQMFVCASSPTPRCVRLYANGLSVKGDVQGGVEG